MKASLTEGRHFESTGNERRRNDEAFIRILEGYGMAKRIEAEDAKSGVRRAPAECRFALVNLLIRPTDERGYVAGGFDD